MRGGSRAAANLGENEDAGGVARGMGRVEWGWRAECCPGPARDQSNGPRDGHTHLVISGCVGSMAWILLLGVRGLGSAWASRSRCPVPQPSLQRGKLFSSIPAPAAAACLRVPVPQVATACSSSQGTQQIFWGKSALGSGCRHCLMPHIYTQVPIPHLLYPGFLRCQHLRDTAAFCGQLRFIHYFISTRL